MRLCIFPLPHCKKEKDPRLFLTIHICQYLVHFPIIWKWTDYVMCTGSSIKCVQLPWWLKENNYRSNTGYNFPYSGAFLWFEIYSWTTMRVTLHSMIKNMKTTEQQEELVIMQFSEIYKKENEDERKTEIGSHCKAFLGEPGCARTTTGGTGCNSR